MNFTKKTNLMTTKPTKANWTEGPERLRLGKHYIISDDEAAHGVAEIRDDAVCAKLVHRYNTQPALAAACQAALDMVPHSLLGEDIVQQLRAALEKARAIKLPVEIKYNC